MPPARREKCAARRRQLCARPQGVDARAALNFPAALARTLGERVRRQRVSLIAISGAARCHEPWLRARSPAPLFDEQRRWTTHRRHAHAQFGEDRPTMASPHRRARRPPRSRRGRVVHNEAAAGARRHRRRRTSSAILHGARRRSIRRERHLRRLARRAASQCATASSSSRSDYPYKPPSIAMLNECLVLGRGRKPAGRICRSMSASPPESAAVPASRWRILMRAVLSYEHAHGDGDGRARWTALADERSAASQKRGAHDVAILGHLLIFCELRRRSSPSRPRRRRRVDCVFLVRIAGGAWQGCRDATPRPWHSGAQLPRTTIHSLGEALTAACGTVRVHRARRSRYAAWGVARRARRGSGVKL